MIEMSNDEDEIRPAKRHRTSKCESEVEQLVGDSTLVEVDAGSSAKWTRDPKYYFEDGNIVLLAEQTVFRVHKGVLTLHSGLLKDMLKLPQETNPELEDGCPLVRLHDPVFHIQWLLETMYHGATTELLHSRPPQASDIYTLYTLSCVGSKYDFQYLLDYAYKKLVLLFPTDDASTWRPCKGIKQMELNLVVQMIRLWHPRAANLLPLVFYAYCQLPLLVITTSDRAGLPPLAWTDTERCILAIPQLLKHKLRTYDVFTIHRTNYPNWCGDIACSNRMMQLSHALMTREDTSALPNPLENLEKWCRQRRPWKELCSVCTRGIVAELDRRRLEAWNDLGKIFNIPEWRISDAPPV